MAELTTYLGTRVADDVKQTFGDEGGVQLTDAMLLRWINDGQREIAQDNDVERGLATAPLIGGQQVIDLSRLFTGMRIKQVESVLISGRVLQLLPFSDFIRTVQDAPTATGDPERGMLRGQALTLHPVPVATVASAVTVYFTQWPLELTQLTDPLTVPDRFYLVLRDYVLAQAYQMNDDLEGSNMKLQQVAAGLQGQYGRDSAAPTDIYPVVPGNPEDWS